MDSLARSILRASRMRGWQCVKVQTAIRFSPSVGNRAFHTSNTNAGQVSHIIAPQLSDSEEPLHVKKVAERLQKDGILKITLGFQDQDSNYLEALIKSLHSNHQHRLPISHSATKGWFWDVRPSITNFQTANHQARSETMEDFPWHTDCSYEHPPPRYFALQVLQPDRFGGGTLSVMSAERISEYLSAETLATLKRPEYRITIPTEFVKDPSKKWIQGSLIITDDTAAPSLIRFRDDIVTPLSSEAGQALAELKNALQHLSAQSHSRLHLSAKDLPGGSIILIDNRRWLHARNHVTDPERHLRRVRWDAAPFPVVNDAMLVAEATR